MAMHHQPDSSGLQAVEHGSAPEVAFNSAPEILPPAYDNNKEQNGDRRSKQTIFGIRRKLFFSIGALVALLVIIAVVVGGVLGSKSHTRTSSKSPDPSNSTPSSGTNSTSSSGSNSTTSTASPIKALSSSGVSVIVPAGSTSDSTFYSYYQAENGTIVENTHTNGSLASSSSSNVVVTNAVNRSPIAATSWNDNGTVFRIIYYFSSDGQLLTSNTTQDQSWSEPHNILTGDTTASNAVGLTVCLGTGVFNTGGISNLDGLSVYYASSKGYIQEVQAVLSSSRPTWHMYYKFMDADTSSGVSCVLDGSVNHVYLRNSTSSAIQQWTWDYTETTAHTWEAGPSGGTNIAEGSDIAVAKDGTGIDHIFYQNDAKVLERVLFSGAAIQGSQLLESVTVGTKLGAAWVSFGEEAGAVIMYQNATDSEAVYYDQIATSGQEITNGIVS